MHIVIKIKDVYGKRRAYPVCDVGKAIADVAGAKTLTWAQLRRLAQGGIATHIAHAERPGESFPISLDSLADSLA